MNTVPDSVDPIKGWRVWALVAPRKGWSSWYLGSLRSGYVWPACVPAIAQCQQCSNAPTWDCSCGLYAFKDTSFAEPPQLDPLYPLASVLGEVAGWGRVIDHQRGWRASNVYPQSLALICAWCLVSWLQLRPAEFICVSQNWAYDSCAACPAHVCEQSEISSGWQTILAREVEEGLLSKYGVARCPTEHELLIHLQANCAS